MSQEKGASEPTVGEKNMPESPPQKAVVDEVTNEATTAAPTAPEPSDDAGGETPKMAHDSMVTVRLSEPPHLTLDTKAAADGEQLETSSNAVNAASREGRSSLEPENTSDTASVDLNERRSTVSTISADANRSLQDELAEGGDDKEDGSSSSDDGEEVNWEKLEKTEGEQTKDEETDNSTTLLLQRLEQENAKLATNPKTVKVQAEGEAKASRPRPPSMAQLQEMVNGPTPSNLRYSMLPPPPMTDLEFWAALVKDYHQTAGRLPTLLSNKIHKGIPPPLRGVVWQSMSGARDAALEEQYERYCGESSPYELIIGKDLGRSFPGVDMFRDPEGDGQRMLGRVLKCFSLYDAKIGYCQGLAFLVGPLLMHMPDKQAFCVLVRLMERYDLRTCFLPDLSGLHVRIYQFRQLLKQNLPAISNHLEELQVDPAYVSQWFLSFFAVTCPLPMLFRIYDVIFAEGASETLMRVALSLMRRNEARLLACTELEDAMQLLLSRGLWDCYHYDADEFVADFVSLTSEVSRENLSQLEKGYRDSLVASTSTSRASDISNAASRFLGRLWATSSTIAQKPTSLDPGATAQAKSMNSLRRTTSKQSLASTLNSMEASTVSVTSSTSTDVSIVSGASSQTEEDSSSRESTPVGIKSVVSTAKTSEDRNLHSQIEDLLTAMSELQRDHAELTNQLQREKEERQEDHAAFQNLVDALRQRTDLANMTAPKQTDEPTTSAEGNVNDPIVASDVDEDDNQKPEAEGIASPALSELVDKVQDRINSSSSKTSNRGSVLQSKVQLRQELAQAKDQLASSMSQTQDVNRRALDLDQEISSLKDQLRESHAHVRTLCQDKQRLVKQVHTLRTRSTSGAANEPQNLEPEADPTGKGANGGLREFKLSRSKSSPLQGGQGKRLSSLPGRRDSTISAHSIVLPSTPTSPGIELQAPPANENEALLIELAQVKTAEAVARQEAEEAKQKLETLRRSHGIVIGESTPSTTASGNPAMAAFGMLGRLTGQGQGTAGSTESSPASKPAATTSGSSTVGGFWGWRK